MTDDDERITYAAAVLAAEENARMPAKQWARAVAQDMAEDTMTDTPINFWKGHPHDAGFNFDNTDPERWHEYGCDLGKYHTPAILFYTREERDKAFDRLSDSIDSSDELQTLKDEMALSLEATFVAQQQRDTALKRVAKLEKLLARCIKYAREDRMRTPGVTRLARALGEAERLLGVPNPRDEYGRVPRGT